MLPGYHHMHAAFQGAIWQALADSLSTTSTVPTIIIGSFNAYLLDSYITDVPVCTCYSLSCKPPRVIPTGPSGACDYALARFFDPDTWHMLNGYPQLYNYTR